MLGVDADEIWISNIFHDSTNVRGTDIDRSEPGWVALKERQSVSEAELPLNIYAHYKDETFRNLPPAFEGAGGLKLSDGIAAVLQQFDLGKAFLIPIQLYLHDRRTPVDKKYFIYASYERKDAFVSELSRDVRTNPYDKTDPPPYWNMPWEPKDGDIAIREGAPEGADMWMDPKLFGSLFMKGQLVAALREAGYAKIFSLTRCRIILPH
jgi:hypothetical protein